MGARFAGSLLLGAAVLWATAAAANPSAYADLDQRVAAAGLAGLVGPAAACEDDPSWVCLTVTGRWQAQPRGVRLQRTRDLWEAWATLCTRYKLRLKPEQCRITLVTPDGRKVGGSGVASGPVIWIAD